MDTKDAVKKSSDAARKFAREYRDFLIKTNMLSLALAVVIGQAIAKVVDAIVHTIVMPIIGVVAPGGNWAGGLTLSFWRFHFPFGLLLSVLLDFAIIASIVFIITKIFIRQAPAPPTKTCPQCLEAIHIDAKRCKFCTSEVPAAPPPPPPAEPELSRPA